MENIDQISDNSDIKLALKLTEVRLRTTIESLPFDFFAIDKEGYYIMQNATCKEHWGDVVGKTPKDVAPDEKVYKVWKENNERAFAGETVRGEVTYCHEGNDFYCYNIISPIKDNGKIWGILGVNIDITEQKKAEIERNKLFELKTKIIEKVAHEMKTPLVPILGAVELLKILCGDKLDNDVLDLLGIIERGGLRLQKLSDKLIGEFWMDANDD